MRTVVLLIGLNIAALLLASTSQACSCEVRPLRAKFEAAEYVFTAAVISATMTERSRVDVGHPDGRILSSAELVEVHFDPLVDYKGRSAELRRLRTSVGGASCGIELIIGRVYVFFADRHGNVELCDGSHRLADPPERRVLERNLAELRDVYKVSANKGK